MRNLFIVLAIVFAVLGVILTILPIEKLGLIPVFGAVIFSFLALKKSETNSRKVPMVIFIFALVLMMASLSKIAMTKDEVIIDQKDEIIKIESQKQDQKDLEELDGL